MNWYRVTFRISRELRGAEVHVHSAADAPMCAAVKLGLWKAAEGVEIELVALECIDAPAWAEQASKAIHAAVRPPDK